MGKFDEKKAQVVEIKNVTFTGLKKVIQCIYTTKIDINTDNIADILPTAHLLQMSDIVQECKGWMSREISMNNCFDFLRLAEQYSIETVEAAITDFILKNFVAVSEMADFLTISQQALCRYLSSDVLKTDTKEIAVFKAARNWILKNNIIDETAITDIMSNVRFALISTSTLSELVFTDDLMGTKQFRLMVAEAMKFHADIYSQPFYQGNMGKPRGKKGLLVIPIGEIDDMYTADSNGHIDFLPFPAFTPAKQSSSLDMPIVRDSMSAVQINNFLFLFGCASGGYQNFTMRYDASNDSWIKLEPVPRGATVGSTATFLEKQKQIILIGGMKVNHKSKFEFAPSMVIAETYIYDIQKNTWSQGKDLPQRLAYSGTATVGDIAYVTGGYSSIDSSTDTVYAYDVKAKLWLTKAKMNQRRCEHTLSAIKERLYAIGGQVVDGDNPRYIEVYDTLSNEWRIIVSNAGYELISSSSVVNGSIIYIIGGASRGADEIPRKIHIYDVDRKKILMAISRLPSDSESNVSAFLTLPKLL